MNYTDYYEINIIAVKDFDGRTRYAAKCVDLPDEYVSVAKTPRKAWESLSETLESWRDHDLIANRQLPKYEEYMFNA